MMQPPGPNSPMRVLFVLSGCPCQDSHGVWHTALFAEGGMGDRLRVEAAALLYPGTADRIVVSGGKGRLAQFPDAPSCAQVCRRELLELGIPAAHLLAEESSRNTYEQLQWIKGLLASSCIERLTVVSNRYHLQRVQALLDADPQLHLWHKERRIETLAAEDVLLKHDFGRWHSLIAEAYATPAMQARMDQEEKGIRDLAAGIYGQP